MGFPLDRITGTTAVRAGLYRRSWEAAKDGALIERGIQGAQTGFHKAQAVTRTAEQEVARLAENDRIRQLRESEQVKQLRELGNDAGRRTVDAARRPSRQSRDSRRGGWPTAWVRG
ncbi:hypothetical protein ACQPZ2_27920 [Nocardia pseudovaccinii]|uniref:hypothetical protein n=1 Tax=Nocardia pseudovaccinii TaxID=189540 RepID=UPI003D8F03BC